jgi:hypothetical protein
MQSRRQYKPATLGSHAAVGDPITVWCSNRACSYLLEHGAQYRAVLSPADLMALAERYGADVTFIDFRARLRCRHCGSGEISTIVDSHHLTPAERWERERET